MDKAVEIHPDLIILDIAMPVMNGFNSARKLKKVLPEVPIIVHTLYWSPQTVTEALKAGAEKAIAKSESREPIAAVEEKLAERETDAGLRPRGAAPLVGSPTLVPGVNTVTDIQAISEKAGQNAVEEPTETNHGQKHPTVLGTLTADSQGFWWIYS